MRELVPILFLIFISVFLSKIPYSNAAELIQFYDGFEEPIDGMPSSILWDYIFVEGVTTDNVYEGTYSLKMGDRNTIRSQDIEGGYFDCSLKFSYNFGETENEQIYVNVCNSPSVETYRGQYHNSNTWYSKEIDISQHLIERNLCYQSGFDVSFYYSDYDDEISGDGFAYIDSVSVVCKDIPDLPPRYSNYMVSHKDYIMPGENLSFSMDWEDELNIYEIGIKLNLDSIPKDYYYYLPIIGPTPAKYHLDYELNIPSDYLGEFCYYFRAKDYALHFGETEKECIEVTYDVPEDLVPPSVTLIQPDDAEKVSEDVIFECSATDAGNVREIGLVWDYSGSWVESDSKIYNDVSATAEFEKTGLSIGTYQWTCYATDDNSNIGWGENRSFTVRDSISPEIELTISPSFVLQGEKIEITVTASDNNEIDSIWINIEPPAGDSEKIYLENGIKYEYSPTEDGNYKVHAHANDTDGNGASVSRGFVVDFSFNEADFFFENLDEEKIPTTFKIYIEDSANILESIDVENGILEDKRLSKQYRYDFKAEAYGNQIRVAIESVNVSDNPSNIFKIQKYENENFTAVFYAEVNSIYEESSIEFCSSQAESLNKMFVCLDWDFENEQCNSDWVEITSEIDITANDCISSKTPLNNTFAISGLTNCTEDDCGCEDGVVRDCAENFRGICAVGTERCINGLWSGCPLPEAETCNLLDDNCDGIIDNIRNSINPNETKCRCSGNNTPAHEMCNGIDDDCDGIIDMNTRPCGTNIGVCSYGTSTCENGSWGECVQDNGNPTEICNNSLDDDCDGEIDEDCEECIDNDRDGFGSPPSNLCRFPENDCDDYDRGTNPGVLEKCDSFDNDCDGTIDENCDIASDICFNGIKDDGEEDVDCGGICPKACGGLTFDWVTIIGVIILIIAVVLYIIMKVTKKQITWKSLEKQWKEEDWNLLI